MSSTLLFCSTFLNSVILFAFSLALSLDMLLILLSILLVQDVQGNRYKQKVADTLQERMFGLSSSRKQKASPPGRPPIPDALTTQSRGKTAQSGGGFFMQKLARQSIKDAPKQSGSFYRPTSKETRTIPTIEPCQNVMCHLSIVVVMDSSSSVQQHNFATQLGFVETFLQIMAVKAEAADLKVCTGIVTYSSEAQIIVNPCCDNTLCSVLTQVNKIEYVRGSTNTAGALKVARQMLQAPASYRRVALLITDGMSNTGGSPIRFASEMRRDDNIDIVALGVTNSVNEYELKKISGYDFVTKIEDFDEFHGLAEALLEANSMDAEGLGTTIDQICESDTTTFKETCDEADPTEPDEKTCSWGSWSSCVQSSSGRSQALGFPGALGSQGPGGQRNSCVQRRTCKQGNRDVDQMAKSCICGSGGRPKYPSSPYHPAAPAKPAIYKPALAKPALAKPAIAKPYYGFFNNQKKVKPTRTQKKKKGKSQQFVFP